MTTLRLRSKQTEECGSQLPGEVKPWEAGVKRLGVRGGDHGFHSETLSETQGLGDLLYNQPDASTAQERGWNRRDRPGAEGKVGP